MTENDTHHALFAARLSHILVTSRFAQTLMVMWRERIGSFMEAGDLERWMQNWLVQYVASSDDRSAANSARYPLRDASLTIGTIPGQPGVSAQPCSLKPSRCSMSSAPDYYKV